MNIKIFFVSLKNIKNDLLKLYYYLPPYHPLKHAFLSGDIWMIAFTFYFLVLNHCLDYSLSFPYQS